MNQKPQKQTMGYKRIVLLPEIIIIIIIKIIIIIIIIIIMKLNYNHYKNYSRIL